MRLSLQDLGILARDNFGQELFVNTRIELCGAFVKSIDITLVNYTEKNDGVNKRSISIYNILSLILNIIDTTFRNLMFHRIRNMSCSGEM